MSDAAVEKEPTPVPPKAAEKKGRGRPGGTAAKKPAVEKKPKAPRATAPKGVKKVSTHPAAAVMVIEAVGKLNEKGGSSLRAIKKYITEVHKTDAEKIAHFIRKALKKAVTDGKLVQTKGTGAAGSFKLPVKGSSAAAKPKKAKAPGSPKKAKSPKKASSPKAPKSPKKAAVKKAAKKPAKKAAPKKAKSPSPAKASKGPSTPKKAEAAAAPAPAAAPASPAKAPVVKKAAPAKKAAKKAKPAAKPKAAKKAAPKKK